jgi:FkbH-like protein
MGRFADMDRVLARRLRELNKPGRLELARETLESLGNQFDADVCGLLINALDGVGDPELKALPDTANGWWMQTQLLSGNLASAWQRFHSFGVRRDPVDLVAWSRALWSDGAHEEAAQKLRQALWQEPGPAVFARAEKLVLELSRAVKGNLREVKIAVMGSSTTGFLTPILKALCFRDRIGVEVYEAPYDSIVQEIRAADSGLARFQPDIVLLVGHWRDLGLEAITADESIWIGNFVEERKSDWKRLSDAFHCHVIQPAFDYPPEEPYGYLSGVLPGGRTRIIDLVNLRLREAAGTNVSILDMGLIQREVGLKRWDDPVAWARYRQYPAMEALPELAGAYLAHVGAALGLSRKLLITDLDNTLWSGVIGEDGVDGIRVGPDTHEGEAHLSLQRYLLDLKRRGILLAVCSKNNPEDARLPFQKHPNMALRLEDFAAFRANWDDKATNLRAIAHELSLGLDSFVFLDDNPLEREWVRSQLPEVAVVELGSSPFYFVRQLDRGRYFETLSLSDEDLARAEQYRVGAQRESLRASSTSLDDFLQSLQLEASVAGVTDKNLARVTQLVNKTNQFNVTTRRYTEAQVRSIAADKAGWAGAFQMADRMGNYGLIGVLFCKAIQADPEVSWEIDTWLMSCRTLGRQMEKFMFDRLLEAALERGVHRLVGIYLPNAKNGLVKELFDQMGFRRVRETAHEVRYELEIPAHPVITATHVRNLPAEGTRA